LVTIMGAFMVVGGCGSIHPSQDDAGIGATIALEPALSLPLNTMEAPITSTNTPSTPCEVAASCPVKRCRECKRYYDDLYQELGIDFDSRYSSASADKLI
jgi:hypothetical protein